MKFAVFRPFARLGFRLMLFNCLLVFLPLGALIFLDVFETRMLESQETTMVSQARVLAAGLGAAWEARALSPHTLSLKTLAVQALTRLGGNTLTRLRVLDGQGEVLADSSLLGGGSSAAVARRAPTVPPTAADGVSEFVYSLGSLPFRVWRALTPPQATYDEGDDASATLRNPAVQAALEGRYGSHTRVSSGQRSVTLYSAVPVANPTGGIGGVVLASQSTWRTLQSLYEIRLTLFQIFLASLALALALSFLVGLTISRPLRRMQAMAEGFIDRWGRPIGRFQLVKGSDELASLSRSLVRLGDGLSDHVRFIESFASDLAHEIRNPLASIQAASELLTAGSPEEQARLSAIIQRESQRIGRLVTLSRELSLADVAAQRSVRKPVDAAEVLIDLVNAWRARGVELQMGTELAEISRPRRTIWVDADFVQQALEKLVENAVDFSPRPETVELGLVPAGDWVDLSVADRGPGIAEGDREAVFKRFHTSRRESGHTGLGLPLARSIAQAFGGNLTASGREGGGAVLTLRLPRAR